MAPHSSTLAWKIPWTEEPGALQSMGSLRVGHDWATSLSLFTWCIGEGNGNPLQCSCLENPRDGEAWWAAVYGVAQSRTRLKRFSSNLWVLIPDDLRWSWCNKDKDKMHNKWHAFESSWNIPSSWGPWKNCLPGNWSFEPKRVGTAFIKGCDKGCRWTSRWRDA